MRRRVLTVVTALALGTILYSNYSWAACAQADLGGTWRLYAISADYKSSFWLYGTIVAQSNGTIKSGTTFTSDSGDKLTVQGGQLKLNSSCVITGTIKFSSSITVTMKNGALGKDKEEFTMVYTNNSGEPGMASGVKK